MDDVGVVIIGRNEGPRLRACIVSVQGQVPAANIVYVDSGSTDGSVALARGLGVAVVELDPTVPFTAARARNLGAQQLLAARPATAFIQFVDGDCEIRPDWLEQAHRYLADHADTAVVCGRRRERFPRRSVFNQLVDMEWNTPTGEAKEFGGDALVRAAAFTALGGYNASLIAGEEPELAVRLRLARWKIVRLDAEMTWHDVAMTRLPQWWKRTVRSGYALAQRAALHGHGPLHDCVHERRSTLLWALALPLLAITAALILGWWTLLLLPAAYAALTVRVYLHRRHHGDAPADAWAYGFFCMLGKFPQALGLGRFYFNHLTGRRARIIEYRQPPALAPAPRHWSRALEPTASRDQERRHAATHRANGWAQPAGKPDQPSAQRTQR